MRRWADTKRDDSLRKGFGVREDDRRAKCSPQQIRIDLGSFDKTEDLAFDDAEHVLPDGPLDSAEAQPVRAGRRSGIWDIVDAGCKPNLE